MADVREKRPFVLVWLDWIYSAAGPDSDVRELLSTMATRMDNDGSRAFQSHTTLGRRLRKHARTISRRCKKAVDSSWLRAVSGGDGRVIVYQATLPPHVQELIARGHTPDRYVSGVTPDTVLSGVAISPPVTSLCPPTPDNSLSGTPDKTVSDDRLLTVTLTGQASKQQLACAPARKMEMDDEQRIRNELKALGVVFLKADTYLAQWIAEGFTLDQLKAKVRFARERRNKPAPMPIFARFLDTIVTDATAVDSLEQFLSYRPPPPTDEEIWGYVRELIHAAHGNVEQLPSNADIAHMVGIDVERLQSVLERHASPARSDGASTLSDSQRTA